MESEGSLKAEDQQFGSWSRAAPTSQTRKNLVTVPGLFKKTNGVSSTPQNPTNPRKPQAQSTVVQPPQESLADVELTQTKNSMSHLRGTVTKRHIYSPPVAKQLHVQAEPLGNEEFKLKNNSPINEARNEFS